MEMIAHSYISDSAPETMFDDVDGFPKDVPKKGRTSKGGRKSTRGRGFGGISKASTGGRHGGIGSRHGGIGRGHGRLGGGRHGGGRQKPRAKRQKITKGRGKRTTSKL
ncbi:hypothetical protein KC19_4G248200 [Ceratodon purpureus]|uniref:Uncharacterized protein n=1 Tax=Ceratodon purpureus TaxID=3225 RepID=A0A8T0IEW3_CERPU|nr:hypothetical protein KC19_4G248200 [Ceratodon purpureus]